jgi:glycosyltransferase involved in cell wall biosynthesis
MRVVLIAPFALAPKATTAARAFPLAAALAERGHAVTLLVPPYDNPADSERSFERDHVQVVHVRSRAHSPGNLAAVTWRLARAARALRPDVVHVFKPVGYAAQAGMALALTGRPRLVVDTDDWEGTGGWNDVNAYAAPYRRWFDFQEHWWLTHARAVTVASRTLQTQAWGYGADPARVFYVPNCPVARFRAWQAPAPAEQAAARARLGVGDAPLAIYVGYVNRNDVLDLAARAAARAGARLAVVGDGLGLPALRAQVERDGLNELVRFTGWVPAEEVPALLAAADVAVYPYRDTLINRSKCSIKILEYMAAGKAILTMRVGQNSEYLEHGQSGWLVEPGDEAAFADGLRTLLADEALRARLGQAAQARVRTHFDWRKWVEVVEAAYTLAARPARATPKEAT